MNYHKDRFKDYSLLIFKAEKLIAVLPANLADNQIFSHQGLTYGGLVYTEKLKLKDVNLIFLKILQFLENNGIKTLHLKLIPSFYSSYPNDEMDYLLFILKAQLQRKDVYAVIDNKVTPIPISKVRKRGLKRAINNGLIIKEEAVFDAFWQTILIPNLKETHQAKPTHTLEEIKLLHNNFPENIKQFNIYKDEILVGGTTIFETKNAAHAQYISANNQRQELGILDVLFDNLINQKFKHKAFFSFGISNENEGQNINSGLLYWKESFGARSITQDFYSVKTSNYRLLDAIFI